MKLVYAVAMKTNPPKVARKLGANPKEEAVKAVKRDPNFKQSRDIRESRGDRQHKNAEAPRTLGK